MAPVKGDKPLQKGNIVRMARLLPNGGMLEAELVAGDEARIVEVSADRKMVRVARVIGGTKLHPKVRVWWRSNPQFAE